MKKIRVLNIFALILNLVICGLGGFALFSWLQQENFDFSKFVLLLPVATALLVLISFISIFHNIASIAKGKNKVNGALVAFKLAAATMILIVTIAYYLVPVVNDMNLGFTIDLVNASYIDSISDFFKILLIIGLPGAAIINLFFFENAKKTNYAVSIVPVALLLVFGGVVFLVDKLSEDFTAPWGFFDYENQGLMMLWYCLAIAGIAWIVCTILYLFRLIFVCAYGNMRFATVNNACAFSTEGNWLTVCVENPRTTLAIAYFKEVVVV